jgi:hypothetical protein
MSYYVNQLVMIIMDLAHNCPIMVQYYNREWRAVLEPCEAGRPEAGVQPRGSFRPPAHRDARVA